MFPPETPRSRSLRLLLLVVIGSVVMAAFWHNGERRLTALAEKGVVTDLGGELTTDTRSALTELAAHIRSVSGLSLKITIHVDPPAMLDVQGGIVRVDVSPRTGEAMVSLPGLWARALGSARLRAVEDDIVFTDGGWQAGLVPAVARLASYLEEASK